MKEEKPKHTHKRKQQQKKPKLKKTTTTKNPTTKQNNPKQTQNNTHHFFLQAHYKEYQPENRYRHALFISPSTLGFSFLG